MKLSEVKLLIQLLSAWVVRVGNQSFHVIIAPLQSLLMIYMITNFLISQQTSMFRLLPEKRDIGVFVCRCIMPPSSIRFQSL